MRINFLARGDNFIVATSTQEDTKGPRAATNRRALGSGPEAAPGAQQVHAEQAYIYFTARVKCLPSGEIPRSCYSRGTAILLGSPFTARVKSCRGVRVGRWVLKTTTRRRRAQVRSGWQSQSIKKCVSMQTKSRPILRRRCI